MPGTASGHCHDHGLIRGPVCDGCDTVEGQDNEFLARPGSLQYLSRCDSCRAQRGLPPLHRLAAPPRNLYLTRGARGCDWPLHRHVSTEQTGGGLRLHPRLLRPAAQGTCPAGVPTHV
ncbi:endonuclease domain-containing protein [Streptomyces parvus]|uniref:endonuclease domain-containing protein n=1 Tax=Streptomyces parvus TaxID=66428 RepID=UPI003D750D83